MLKLNWEKEENQVSKDTLRPFLLLVSLECEMQVNLVSLA